MKQIYLTLVAAAAIAFSSVEANALTVNEIVGKYTATNMDFSEFHAVFTQGNEKLTEPLTWDDMEITIVEGNRIKVANFIKQGINGCTNAFDIEGDFDPSTNTITFQPKLYEYKVGQFPITSTNRPMFGKYAEGDELEAMELVEDVKSFTATFDDQKNLTVDPWRVYKVSKDLVSLFGVTGGPKYKVGEAEIRGLYFTKNENSGIENITVGADAPAEYYNLQGVKVENPEDGMYIRRQGGKATKVIIR